MYNRITVYLLIVALVSVAVNTASQNTAENCFPRFVADIVQTNQIRESASPLSEIVSRAAVGDIYEILESRQIAGQCWVKISDGWLPSDALRQWQFDGAAATPTPNYTSPPRAEKCFTRDSIEVVRTTMIYARYKYNSAFIRFGRPGDRFEVEDSWVYSKTCWIKVADGWLPSDTVKAIGDSVATPVYTYVPVATASPEEEAYWRTLPSGCYDAARAFVSGAMNIRQSPTIDSDVVGRARDGAAFKVTQSVQGNRYCWLRIAEGWMAKTNIVTNVAPPRILPRIEGEPWFVARIMDAYHLLKEAAPHWYMYVTGPRIDVIGYSGAESSSLAYTSSRRMEIGGSHMFDRLLLAGVLAHEACHFYQYEEGRLYDLDKWTREEECNYIQTRAMLDIDPYTHAITPAEHAAVRDWRLENSAQPD